jgi:hypothetical protein
MARYSTQTETGRLVVIVPAAFRWSFFLFAPAFIALGFFALRGGSGPISMFMKAWFAILGVILVFMWIWMLKGKEVLEFTSTELIHQRILFGFVRKRSYETRNVWSPFFEVYHGGKGAVHTALSFYYDGKLVRLLDEIQQESAKQIVEAVLRKLPELSPTWERFDEGVPLTKGSTVLNLK